MTRVRQGDHTVLPATHTRTIPAAFIPHPRPEGTAHSPVKHSMYLNSCHKFAIAFTVTLLDTDNNIAKTLRPRVACTIRGHGCSVNM